MEFVQIKTQGVDVSQALNIIEDAAKIDRTIADWNVERFAGAVWLDVYFEDVYDQDMFEGSVAMIILRLEDETNGQRQEIVEEY